MSFLDKITILILTYNEAPNICRTLRRLIWAKRILVVDSGSTDETLGIVSHYPRATILTRPFDNFASQCNFGLSNILSDWVLSLDADYELSAELISELQELSPPDEIAGYSARFIYRMYGRALRGSLYPPRIVLYRRVLAKYRNVGHGHRVIIDGPIRALRGPIYHDDRKSLARWFRSQQKYAKLEADHLLSATPASLCRADKIRHMSWAAPLIVFLDTLIVKRSILDGWPGWLYVLQRLLAETMIAIELVDRRLRSSIKSTERGGVS
jgi:glycosyltransferase involved in cell wall biosynthesis